ncbi:hypothetical protein EBT25_16830 [bacterium]|nr:hypothetical protein [bacterium]
MAAPDNTKFQVNYKLADGTLVNLYATDVKELETGLTDLQMVSALIISTSDQFHSIRPAAPVPSPVAAPAAAPAQTGANTCKHGTMAYREGVNAQGRAWKGYMCAAPKGATDKCATIWVR